MGQSYSLLDRSWRLPGKDKWNVTMRDKVRTEIGAIDINKKGGKASVVLFGPVGSGKSSFLNSVFSICKNRQSQMTYAEYNDASVTKKYRQLKANGLFSNINLYDTMGFMEGKHGFNVADIDAMLGGHVKPGYEFVPNKPISKGDPFYIDEPDPEDIISCVVLVIDSEILLHKEISSSLKADIQQLRECTKSLDIPIMLLLTKVDNICSFVEKDVSNMFRSKHVLHVVKTAEQVFGFQQRNIYPVKNYEKETTMDYTIDIPLLLALRQMIYFACDFNDNSD